MTNTTATGAMIVPVKGVGVFTFAHRSMGNQIAIECEYSRLTEGLHAPTEFLGRLAQTVADLTVLTISAPKDWGSRPDGTRTDVLSEMDAFDPETFDLITRVWSALSDKEAAFRQGRKPQGGGAPAGGTDEPVVPPAVQPTAD